MGLYCASCDAPHDVDLGVDEGVCMICGEPLIEDDSERPAVGPSAFGRKLVDAVVAGLAAAQRERTRDPSRED